MKKEEEFVRVCQRCFSPNLKTAAVGLSIEAVAISPIAKCIDCNFVGMPIEAKLSDLKELRKQA